MDKRLFILFGTFLLIMGFTSCTSEEAVTPDGKEMITLEIPFTRATEEQEKDIQNARIIVCYNTGSKKVIVNEDVPIQTNPNYVFKVVVPVGYCSIYLIANEKSTWTLNSLTEGTSNLPTELKTRVMNYNELYPVVDSNNPIPMFGQYENVYVDNYGNLSQNGTPIDLNSSLGTVERIFSKVTLNLSCIYADLPNNGDPIEVESVSVKRMPKLSYLVPEIYGTADSHFFNGANAPSTDYIFTTSGSNTTGFTGKSEFYIPEYLLTDTSRYTYLSVVVRLVNSSDRKREYKIAIGNGIEKGNAYMLGNTKTVPDLRVNRNTHFTFTMKIVSFSESSDADVDIIAEIVPWNEGLSITPPDPSEYVLDISPSSEFSIGTGIYNGMVNIHTDYPGGWSVSDYTPGIDCTVSTGKLEFTVPSSLNEAFIDVKAGPVTKRINITRKI